MEISIKKILDGYKIKTPSKVVCKTTSLVIEEKLGVKIDADNISYQKGYLRLDTTPLVRTQIKLHQKDIIEEISKELDQNIKNVN